VRRHAAQNAHQGHVGHTRDTTLCIPLVALQPHIKIICDVRCTTPELYEIKNDPFDKTNLRDHNHNFLVDCFAHDTLPAFARLPGCKITMNCYYVKTLVRSQALAEVII
jgi:hypothetical protein